MAKMSRGGRVSDPPRSAFLSSKLILVASLAIISCSDGVTGEPAGRFGAKVGHGENSVFRSGLMNATEALLGTRSVYVPQQDDLGLPLYLQTIDPKTSMSVTMDQVFAQMVYNAKVGASPKKGDKLRWYAEIFQVLKSEAEGFLRSGKVGGLMEYFRSLGADDLRAIALALGLVDPDDTTDNWECLTRESFWKIVGSAAGCAILAGVLGVFNLIVGSSVKLERTLGGDVVASVTIPKDTKTGRVISWYVRWQESRRAASEARVAAAAAAAATTPAVDARPPTLETDPPAAARVPAAILPPQIEPTRTAPPPPATTPVPPNLLATLPPDTVAGLYSRLLSARDPEDGVPPPPAVRCDGDVEAVDDDVLLGPQAFEPVPV